MEKRKCVICGDEFTSKFQRQDSSGKLQNIWYYNYYCSPGCFEDGEKMLFDTLLSLKERGVEVSVPWITKENQQLRDSYNNIDWCTFLRLNNPQLKEITNPSIYNKEELEEVEEVEQEEDEEEPKGIMALIEKNRNRKPGPGQMACGRCKSIIGVRTKICPICRNEPRI